MRRTSIPATILATVVFALALASPAVAQLNRTWVASSGSDSANCDRPTPCATFGGAYSKTLAGGEITCADSGNYSGVIISKPLTINCEAAIGTTTPVGGSGIGHIGVSGLGATEVVILRGIEMDGADNVSLFPSAISFTGAGTLRLEKMKISNYQGISHGVDFTPSGTAKLYVTDSIIANNASSGVHAGIHIQPTSGQTTIAIERTVVENNQFGIFADGTAGGTIRGMVTDSFVSGNTDNGISVNTSGASVSLMIDNTKMSGNNYGLAVAGAGGLLLVRRSTITGNNNGLATFSGGQAVSYRDNAVNNNTVDGAFSFAIATQ